MPTFIAPAPDASVSQETSAASQKKDLAYFAAEIGRHFYQTTEHVFQVADLCADAMKTLSEGDRTRLVGIVRFSKGTLSKMVRISHDGRLRTEAVRTHLPTNYTTLYEITHLTDAQLAAAIADSVIRVDMRRAELDAWLHRDDEKEDEPEVLASILGHENLSEGRLAMLRESLRKAMIGFPEIEIRGKRDKWSFRGVYRLIPAEAA